ncbi:putative uncharacterized protein [Burkholderiales bacterium GJ-E10]|nr:putative uncharacterized protein [Burkholderiales bacterium GJ-E10]
MRLLLIEDDVALGRSLKAGLQQFSQKDVDWVRTAAEARAAWFSRGEHADPYEAVITDVDLPDGNGIDLIRIARNRRVKTPVLIMSEREHVADRVHGLDAGADDYLVKPVACDEIAARLRAIRRRMHGPVDERKVLGALAIDTTARLVTLCDEPIDLSAREFTVLMALARRPGAIVSRAQIESALYGWDSGADSNTIEVYVHHLRRKLGASTIQTQRGLGYRLVAPMLS